MTKGFNHYARALDDPAANSYDIITPAESELLVVTHIRYTCIATATVGTRTGRIRLTDPNPGPTTALVVDLQAPNVAASANTRISFGVGMPDDAGVSVPIAPIEVAPGWTLFIGNTGLIDADDRVYVGVYGYTM